MPGNARPSTTPAICKAGAKGDTKPTPARPSRLTSALFRASIVTAALAAGCASFTAEDCRNANWYRMGERDALLYGLQPQIGYMAHACQKAGVPVSEKEYMDGWFVGDRERAVRLLGGACCPH